MTNENLGEWLNDRHKMACLSFKVMMENGDLERARYFAGCINSYIAVSVEMGSIIDWNHFPAKEWEAYRNTIKKEI